MDERTTRLGFPYTDEELAAMGEGMSFDFDLEDSPRRGESFQDWLKRTGRDHAATQRETAA